MNTPLTTWTTEHVPDDDLLWRDAFAPQILFVRETLARLVFRGMAWAQWGQAISVVGTHTSKSVVLPVYEVHRPDIGLRLVMRHNFHDWKLSVLSERPIVADFTGLFITSSEHAGGSNELQPAYFEGFPEELVFGYYEQSDKQRFSARMDTEHDVYAAVFLVLRSLGVVKPRALRARSSG